MEATEHFSEALVRRAVRCVFRDTSSVRFGVVPAVIAALLVVLTVLAIAGVVDAAVPMGVSAGLLAAVLVIGLMTVTSYRQNAKFPLRVIKSMSHADVAYTVSHAGCSAKYGGVEVLLPWSAFVGRRKCGEFVLLKFRIPDGHIDEEKLRAIGEAMLRGGLAPELLGFPVFCLLPSPKVRYLLVRAELLEAAPESVRAR